VVDTDAKEDKRRLEKQNRPMKTSQTMQTLSSFMLHQNRHAVSPSQTKLTSRVHNGSSVYFALSLLLLGVLNVVAEIAICDLTSVN
jgi:hypothetical protein